MQRQAAKAFTPEERPKQKCAMIGKHRLGDTLQVSNEWIKVSLYVSSREAADEELQTVSVNFIYRFQPKLVWQLLAGAACNYR